MSMNIYLGTQNKGKIAEFQQTWLKEILKLLPDGIEEPVETGSTCRDNAQLKAHYYFQHLSHPVLSDDSGFFIPHLDGFPGVLSSRVIKEYGSIEKVFKFIEDKAPCGAKAYFLTVLCFIDESGQEFVFEGKLEGFLSFPAKGDNGFGYDPIFTPKGYDKPLGELSQLTKLRISHRAKAIKVFRTFYETQVSDN